MKHCLLIITFCTLYLPEVYPVKVIISEISLCNVSMVTDPEDNYQNWIELYNPGNEDIWIQHLRFSDENGKLLKYKLNSHRLLKAKSFELVWLNNEINDGEGNYPDLDADGGFISVADTLGNLLDSFTYPRQMTDITYGRIHEDSDLFAYFTDPTPAFSNANSATASEQVAPPVFSATSGFYTTPVNVSISCSTPGATIFYTLDGSDPTPFAAKYSGTPISIQNSAPLKARAYADGYLKGLTSVATYLINERKPQLPVVMITIDDKYLYDPHLGIYTKGTNGIYHYSNGDTANYNRNWTRPGYFELINEQKELKLSQAVGISVLGTVSRKYDLKSFDIKASKRFGTPRLDYAFFPQKDGRRYKSIALRNGGNQDFAGFIFRDAFSQSFAEDMDLDYQAYKPCVLYVNGKYWGLLNMREKSTKDYIYSNYNFAPNEIDLVYLSEAKLGTTRKLDPVDSIISRNPIINDSLYNQLKSLIDIDNFMNYLTVESVFFNTDWPVNNNRHFTHRGHDGRFRWILNDMDRSLLFEGHNVIERINAEDNYNLQHRLIRKLSDSEAFRNHLTDLQSIYTATIFREQRLFDRLDSIVNPIRTEHTFHAARWNPDWASWLETGYNNTKDRLGLVVDKSYLDLKNNFGLGDTLSLIIQSDVSSAALHFNGLRIPFLPYDGRYFKDKKIKLNAPEYADGRKFRYWLIKELKRTTMIHTLECELEFRYSTTITAVYGKADKVRRTGFYINEISPANSIYVDNYFNYEDWIEIYNNSSGPLSLEGYYLSNNKDALTQFRFEAQQPSIPPHGNHLVWCSNATWKGPGHTNFRLKKEGGQLFLSKDTPDGLQIIDSISYPAVGDKKSVGRYPDGEDQLYIFNRPSFKKPNYYSFYNIPVYRQEPALTEYIQNPEEELNLKIVSQRRIITIIREQRPSAVIEIYNMSGTVVIRQEINNYLDFIDMHAYPPGLYILKYSDPELNQTRKVIL